MIHRPMPIDILKGYCDKWKLSEQFKKILYLFHDLYAHMVNLKFFSNSGTTKQAYQTILE